MIEKPVISRWNEPFFYPLDDLEQKAGCIYMKRLRCVENDPVMLESTYISNVNLSRFCTKPFVKGSLFETLNVNYAIEITRVDEDLRSVLCDEDAAGICGLKPEVRFCTFTLNFIQTGNI